MTINLGVFPVNNEPHMIWGEFRGDTQISSQCVYRPVRLTAISQWTHIMWLTKCGSHGAFKISHMSHMSSHFVSFYESSIVRLLWYVCYLTYVFCETRFVTYVWDFLKSLLWYLIPHVCLLWVSPGEIIMRFFTKSFVIDMISHGGLLWDSLGEITVRFSWKSFWGLLPNKMGPLYFPSCLEKEKWRAPDDTFSKYAKLPKTL